MNTTEIIRPHHKSIAMAKGLFYGVALIFSCWAATLAWQACCELASRGERELTSYLIERQMQGEWVVDAKGTTINGRKITLEEAKRVMILLKSKYEDSVLTLAEIKDRLNEDGGF